MALKGKRISSKSALFLITLLIISLAGCLVIQYATYWGPWAYSDSTEYIAAARSLLAGHGLGYQTASGDFELYSLHPPLYPLVLSGLAFTGFDILEAARWFNIVLFGLTVFFSGVIAYTILRSAWFALALSLALSTIPLFVDVSSGAMSEPLFIFTSTLAIGLLVLYLDRKNRALLVGSAISAALATLSRYPGMVVVVTCAIGLLAAGSIPWKRRLLEFGAFCLASFTPLVAWLAWLYSQSQSLAVRTFLLPGNLQNATMALRKSMMEVFLSWLPYREFLPSYNYSVGRNYLHILLMGLAALAGLMILRLWFKRPASQYTKSVSTYAFLWALFSIGNLVLLAITFLFTTPTPDINSRTLLPVQFGSLFFAILLFAGVVNEFHLPYAVSAVCGLLVFAFIYPNAQASWKLMTQYHQFGLGYTSVYWHNSLTLQALRDLPGDTAIITNEPTAVLLQLDRAAYDFCASPCNPSSGLLYGDDFQDPVQQIFREQRAALALFSSDCDAQNHSTNADPVSQSDTLTRSLRQAFHSCDGAIYFYPSTQDLP